MTKASITKTMNKIKNWVGPESLATVRQLCLPARIHRDIGVAYVVEHRTVKGWFDFSQNFFGSMTDKEFREYLVQL